MTVKEAAQALKTSLVATPNVLGVVAMSTDTIKAFVHTVPEPAVPGTFNGFSVVVQPMGFL